MNDFAVLLIEDWISRAMNDIIPPPVVPWGRSFSGFMSVLPVHASNT